MRSTTWKKVCPVCGSVHTDRHSMPFWGKCRECGFESMASEDLIRATDAWNNGYTDIEGKAQDVGIEGLTDAERLDLGLKERRAIRLKVEEEFK